MAFRHRALRALRFRDLMPHRVTEVLLVSSPYDAFLLEQDGGLNEQVFLEYSDVGLPASPRIGHAASPRAALELLGRRRFDLVIATTNLGGTDVETFGRQVKAAQPGLPVVLLSLDRRELHELRDGLDRQAIDRTFLWNGDSRILLAIIKYVEDRANVEHDVEQGDVRVLIVIEDSPSAYSSFLGILYKELMRQAHALYGEGVNEILRQAYMKSRPKILHATSFEEGWDLLSRYRRHVLALISDVRIPRGGQLEAEAGLDFVAKALETTADLPVLLQSADLGFEARAERLGAAFVHKGSPDLPTQIRDFLADRLGFGDFVFRTPDGVEIDRAQSLRELEEKLADVPRESVLHHASRNEFSLWLMARSEFGLAERLRELDVSDFSDAEALRRYLVGVFGRRHRSARRRVVSELDRKDFDDDPFSAIGRGSLGGKARGIAFLNLILRESEATRLGGLRICIPKTVVITTEHFDRFLDSGDLREHAFGAEDDPELLRRFLEAPLPADLESDLSFVSQRLAGPVAVRSSGLLEDAMRQPFAGVYSTVMLPNDDPRGRLQELAAAVKLVWASTFSTNAKAYMRSAAGRIEEERMAVIIQRLVGRRHGRRFYPTFSGLAQSYNFYPIGHQQPEEGIAHVALGLGRFILEGGQAVRFSPRHPLVSAQLADAEALLDQSQRHFFALDLERSVDDPLRDFHHRVQRYDLETAERDGTLSPLGSVFIPDDGTIRDDLSYPGPRLVTFNNILKHRTLPLAEAVEALLELGREGFASGVEIEFACETGAWAGAAAYGGRASETELHVLQIRPLGSRARGPAGARLSFAPDDTLCASRRTLGDGVEQDIRDIVYVPPERWDPARSREIAAEVGRLNEALVREGRPYLLIGPGRWGSADPWLGIPVQWSQISGVKVLIEASPLGFDVEPSQGTHFFHNLTTLQIGYLTLPAGARKAEPPGDEYLDWGWLEEQPAYRESESLRLVRLEEPLTVVLDGAEGEGTIAKPAARPVSNR